MQRPTDTIDRIRKYAKIYYTMDSLSLDMVSELLNYIEYLEDSQCKCDEDLHTPACNLCKHSALRGSEEPCDECDIFNSNYEER